MTLTFSSQPKHAIWLWECFCPSNSYGPLAQRADPEWAGLLLRRLIPIVRRRRRRRPTAQASGGGGGDGGGVARDRSEAGEGEPREGDERAAAGLIRGAGVAFVGAAARDRRAGGQEGVAPRRQHRHVLRHVGVARGALRPRRRALPAHLRVPPPRHLRGGAAARLARVQEARCVCFTAPDSTDSGVLLILLL